MASSKIIPKKSVQLNKVPEATALIPGEIAVNYADQVIYGRHPDRAVTATDAVVPLAAPYLHSHDQLLSLNRLNELEIIDTGELKLTTQATASVSPIATKLKLQSTEAREILFPDKDGTVAFLSDLGSGGGGGSGALLSPDSTEEITLTNAGQLSYRSGSAAAIAYDLPATTGRLGLRGGDTVVSATAPQQPYIGLRWIDSTQMRAFDWMIDSTSNTGIWVEVGGGPDGRQVNFRVNGGYIQWSYSGDNTWVNLISLNSIKGDTGPAAELRVNSTHIQWKYTTESALDWKNLKDLESLRGLPGTVTSGNIQLALGYLPDNPTAARTPTTHNHDSRYYTETEVDSLLNAKQPAGSYSVQGHGHAASEITGVFNVDQLPVLPTQAPTVSSGNLAALTAAQQSAITAGTVVITTDGLRQVYKGVGSKTEATSYITLADLTPSWAAVADKPSWISSFNPSTAIFSAVQISGLASVATSGDYLQLSNRPGIPDAQVNSDWSASSGISSILNKPSAANPLPFHVVAFSGDYADLINKPVVGSQSNQVKSSWENPYSYIGKAAVNTATSSSGWTITRITTSSNGTILSTQTATGAWDNRTNLF
jgi:hypothetical protein